MAILSPSPKLQFFDANGNPLVGGKLYTYAAGTTTPLASYTDSSGGTANTNPIILDSRGEANVWLASGTAYKFVLQSAASATIWTVDNIDATLGTMASQNANNVAITGGSITGLTTFTTTNGATIQGLTVGKGAGSVATNTAVGASALASNTSGTQNTAVGANAGQSITSGVANTVVGQNAGASVTTGQITAVGYAALTTNTTASGNTAVGVASLRFNTTGANNTALGDAALNANTTASNNTAVGYQAGYSNTTGTAINAFGYQALYSNTTGTNNTGVGQNVMALNTTGSYNVAVGELALRGNTTASNNTAVGYQAGYSNTTGTYSTLIGTQAGYSQTTGYGTHVGWQAGYSATTGQFNTFIGLQSGYAVTTGSKNTILGGYTGNQGGLDIRTANNYIVLSDGDGNPRLWHDGSGTLKLRGSTANARLFAVDSDEIYPSVDNTMSVGISSLRWSVIYAATGTINTSDANTKQDVEFLTEAERRVAVAIKGLIRTFRFKDAVAQKGDSARIHVGVMAQAVQDAFTYEGLDASRYALFCSDTWYEVDGKPSETAAEPFTADTPNSVEVTRLGIRYDELLAFVIAAL